MTTKWILGAGVLLASPPIFSSPRQPVKSITKPATNQPARTKSVPPVMMVAPFVTPQPSYLATGIVVVPKHTTAVLKNQLRGPVFLPIGSANVALHKNVTSSDEYPIIGSPALATDGDKEGLEGEWVELGTGIQWIQVDLQNSFPIYGFLFWHYPAQMRVYRDVIIQVADDANFTQNRRTVYNNDDDNSSGFGKGKDLEFYENYSGQWIPIKVEKARYVRFYSNGNNRDTANQYTEIEVWATPAIGKAKPIEKPSPTKPAANDLIWAPRGLLP